MPKKSKPYYLSIRSKRILFSLQDALVEKHTDYPLLEPEQQMIRRCETLIREFPKTMRWGFVLGMYFFDRFTFLFGFGFRRFVNLKRDQKKKYLDCWLESSSHNLRNLAIGLRGFVLLAHFSHKDVFKHIGYDPKTHVESKIALRQKLLSQSSLKSEPPLVESEVSHDS